MPVIDVEAGARLYHNAKEGNVTFPLRKTTAARVVLWSFFGLVFSGCALSNRVTIHPISLLPSEVHRSPSVELAAARGDFMRAIRLHVDTPTTSIARKLVVAESLLACGRLEAAEALMLEILDLEPERSIRAQASWLLSQVHYMRNDSAQSLAWAQRARANGIPILDWHLRLLGSLSEVPLYVPEESESATVRMQARDPRLPRLGARINGHPTVAIIDSGAVHTIISRSFAAESGIRPIGDFQGTFYGLVGQPIPVSFGLIDDLTIDGMRIRNVPVAIMADDKLRFFIVDRSTFDIDLLFGSMFLKEFRLRFDNARSLVRLEYLRPEARRPADHQNLFFIGFRPFVHAAVNRRGWYPFLLDTGSEITFLNRAALDLTGAQLWGSGTYRARLQGLGGTHRWGEKLGNVSIAIERWAGLFRHVPLYDNPDSRAVGIIGQNLLDNFQVVLDFGTMRLELIRQ